MTVGADLPAAEHVHAPAEQRALRVVLGFRQLRAGRDAARVEHADGRGGCVGAVQAAQQDRPVRSEGRGGGVLQRDRQREGQASDRQAPRRARAGA